jgi:hypothetical protein
MTKPRDGLFIPVKWLASLMAGEENCQWGPWFKAHYAGYDQLPSDFQMASWTAEHTVLLDTIIKQRSQLSEGVFKEEQNNFKLPVKGKPGMKLSGKPDLVTVDAAGLCRVFDAKTGMPRQSDTIQVMLYMMLLPHLSAYRGKEFTGYVVYKTGVSEIPWVAINAEFSGLVTHFINILGEDSPPPKTPSFYTCRFCRITTADCPERYVSDPSAVPDDEGYEVQL